MCKNLISAIQKMLNNNCFKNFKHEEPATNIIAAYLNKESGDDEIILTECPMGLLLKDENQKGEVDLACWDISDLANPVKWVAEAKASPYGAASANETEYSLQDCFDRFFGSVKKILKKKDNIASDANKLGELRKKKIKCYYIMYIKRKAGKTKNGGGGGKITINDWNITSPQKFGLLKLELIQIVRAREGAQNEFQGALLWEVKGVKKE